MGPEGAVNILYKRELKLLRMPSRLAPRKCRSSGRSSPIPTSRRRAASSMEVIRPQQTRRKLIAALPISRTSATGTRQRNTATSRSKRRSRCCLRRRGCGGWLSLRLFVQRVLRRKPAAVPCLSARHRAPEAVGHLRAVSHSVTIVNKLCAKSLSPTAAKSPCGSFVLVVRCRSHRLPCSRNATEPFCTCGTPTRPMPLVRGTAGKLSAHRSHRRDREAVWRGRRAPWLRVPTRRTRTLLRRCVTPD